MVHRTDIAGSSGQTVPATAACARRALNGTPLENLFLTSPTRRAAAYQRRFRRRMPSIPNS